MQVLVRYSPLEGGVVYFSVEPLRDEIPFRNGSEQYAEDFF